MTSVRANAAVAEQPFPGANFRSLWAATGVSQLGSAVTLIAIPLVAVLSLGATPNQMAIMVIAELAPALLIRLPVAAWSDTIHSPRVRLMIACNLTQAAIAGLTPLLWLAGALTFNRLAILASVSSTAIGVYSALAAPMLVSVVAKAHLVDANGKLGATRSAADIGGPALAGGLLTVLTPAYLLLVDALSFVGSALLLSRVRPLNAVAAQEAPHNDTAEQIEAATKDRRKLGLRGWARLAGWLLRRPDAQALVSVGLVNGMVQPVLVLFLVHDLHLAGSMIGFLLGFGAVGGVVGGLLVGRAISRFGPGKTLSVGTVSTICSLLLLPFGTAGPLGVASVVIFELAGSFGGTLLVATVFGTLQGAAPMGRVSSVMALTTTLLQAAALVGAPVGSLLATSFGVRAAIATAAASMAVVLATQLTRWSTSAVGRVRS